VYPAHDTFYANSFRGLNVLARAQNNYADLRALGANWIALVVQCQQEGTATDCSGAPDDATLRQELEAAHAAGLKVMLKPHIETTQYHWRGQIRFDSAQQVAEWFAGYEPLVLRMAELKPDALAVGTELAQLSGNEEAWRALVAAVRQKYGGPLTYAANYDEAPHVNWWDAVDVIGVDAYFPLRAPPDAQVDQLVRAWQPHRAGLEALARLKQKQILFTEIGYESRASSYVSPWERNPPLLDLNAQAYAYQAVFESFRADAWWAGALFWDWQTDRNRVGFSPINKPALGVLMSNWRTGDEAAR
jgi:hypothetical protein